MPKAFVYIADRKLLNSVFVLILPLIFRYCYMESLTKDSRAVGILASIQCLDLSADLDKGDFFNGGDAWANYIKCLRST